MSDTETTEAPAPAAASQRRRPHLYLVDGSSYIFRAYHRLPPLTNRHGHAGGRGLWLYDDAVEARRRRCTQGRRADPHGGDPRCVGAYPPQRDVRPVQGAPAAAARRPGPAIPADPRRHPRLFDPVHRGSGAGGRRHHRLLRHRGEEGRLEGDDRQLRQGSDAADRRGCRDRHARHDERPPDRTRARCWRSSACRRRRSATCWR